MSTGGRRGLLESRFEKPLAMPYKHGRRYSVIEKIAYGRNDSLSRRSSAWRNSRIYAKDLQPLELDSGNPKLRFPPITVIFVDTDALANGSNYSFILADTTADEKLTESCLPSNMVSPDTSSPIVSVINQDTDFQRSSSSGIGSEASRSGQGKKKLSSFVSSTSGNSSMSISDNTNVVSSDFLVGLFPKVENKVKRKSRKKNKKKGKQRKRVTSTKDSNKSNVQCNAKMHMASTFETSAPSSLCSSDKHIPDSNLSDEVAIGLLDKDDSANTNEFVHCPNLLLFTSYSDAINDFETVSSSERSSDDLHCTTTTWLHSSGNFKNASVVPFSFDGGNGGENCKESSTRAPMDNTFQLWSSDMGESTSDGTVIELPVKDETGPSSSEVPKDSHSYAACLSNDVLDPCCGNARSDYISQDDSSDGFHVVISGKRRRRARRRMDNGALNGENMPINANIHSNMEKDNNYSIWPKLQKFGDECSKPNRVNVSSSHSELTMKDDNMKSKDSKFVGPKKKKSGIVPCSGGNSKIGPSQIVSRESKTVVTIPKSTVGNSVTGSMCESNSLAKQAEHNDWSVTYTAKTDVPNSAKLHIEQREGLPNALPIQLNIQSKTGAKSAGNELSGRCVSKLIDNELEERVPVLTEEIFCHNKLSYIPTTTNQLGQGKIETISVSDIKMNSEDTLGSVVGIEGHEFIKPCFGSYKQSNNLNSVSTSTQNRIPVVMRASADIDKIMIALNDVCKQQRVVEYAQLMIGCPIADFEKFLFSASPTIEQTEGRNISLKNIWKWYEEPGCFGLEVNGHEFCDSRKLPNGYLEFTAYFVPYLSAVQLFGMTVSRRNCNLNSQVDKIEKSSKSLDSHSILTSMLQNSCKNADVCLSEFSSEEEDLSDKNTAVNQADLIFEYFESDLPPRRQPLFDKTSELMAGDTSSDGCTFGNPSVLESTELQDLHPASWYCVAWYPIYRIPIGNLRAAFLTYHSLGNISRRGNPADAPGTCDTLVSPVVGLQAYNDKGENWFRPGNMGSNVLCTDPSTSDLVKERLRALRETAAAMSHTVVSKGDCRSVNRHPDYEFFVSRSR